MRLGDRGGGLAEVAVLLEQKRRLCHSGDVLKVGKLESCIRHPLEPPMVGSNLAEELSSPADSRAAVGLGSKHGRIIFGLIDLLMFRAKTGVYIDPSEPVHPMNPSRTLGSSGRSKTQDWWRNGASDEDCG